VRHLVLPGRLGSTHRMLEWFATDLNGAALLSLLFQYTPNPRRPAAAGAWDSPSRRIRRREHEIVLGWLSDLGIEEGYVQEPTTGASWLPDFRRANPFPQGQAEVLWHFHDVPG
jgi:putative pyruvate formate lyase activating enzyme